MMKNFAGASYACAVGPFAAGFYNDHVEFEDGRKILTCDAGLIHAPSAGIVNGRFMFAGKGDHFGNAWLWNGEQWIDLGVEAYGANEGPPCGFWNDRVFVSSVGSPNVIVFDALTGARLYAFAQEVGTEGIARVAARNLVIPQRLLYGQHGLARYVEFGDVRIGQGVAGGLAAQIGEGPVKWLESGPWQFIAGNYDPAGDVITIAASQFALNRGAVRSFTRLNIEAAPPYATSPPPPPPPPDPTKEEKMRTIDMHPRVPVIVQALYERNVALAEGDDDQRRALMLIIAEQAAFELGARWGTKRAGEGRPPSKDAIAFFDGTTLYGADCFNGATRKPSVPNVLEEMVGQVFIPVQPVNHLGAIEELPKPAPDYSKDIAELKARIADLIRGVSDLSVSVADLAARVAVLEQKPGVDLTPYAKHGDGVTVSGRVSFFGTNRWTGSIDT